MGLTAVTSGGIQDFVGIDIYPASYIQGLDLREAEQPIQQEWESVQWIEALQNTAQVPTITTRNVVKPEDFIWLELSMVPELERVFVGRRGGSFDVMSVVNDRDIELRKRIFARERAIIEALPEYDFDFEILTRMGHDLGDLLTDSEKPAYVRR